MIESDIGPAVGLLRRSGQRERVLDKHVFRIWLRRGQRQILFIPTLVLKLGFSIRERKLLREEARLGAAAARNPFWRQLATGGVGLGAGIAFRRFRSVDLADFPAASAVVEERLLAAAALPRRLMREDMRERIMPAHLAPADRARLFDLLGEQEIPESSMHGDLHFFNFVRARRGYRVIDWEHYEPRGSFAFDYLDFHLHADAVNSGEPWLDVLGRVDEEHHAVRRASRLLGLDPRALLAHYLVLKADQQIARNGSLEASPLAGHTGFLAGLRRIIAGHGSMVLYALTAVAA